MVWDGVAGTHFSSKETITYKPKVTNYKIVSGMPDQVTRWVQEMLDDGWDLNGKMEGMRIDNKDIVVQCMVKYKEEE